MSPDFLDNLIPDLIDNGFAIFVAVFFMYRMERKLDNFSGKIDLLSKTILLLVIDGEDGSNGKSVKKEARKMYESL